MTAARPSSHLIAAVTLLVSVQAGRPTPLPAQDTARPSTEVTAAVEPTLVGPGVISTDLMDFSPALSPDGRTMLFAVTDAGFTRMTIMESERRGNGWSPARATPFSGRWNDGDLALTPDGRRLVFMTNRPAVGSTPKSDFDLWMVERGTDGAWGTPVRLPDAINSDTAEVYPSLAADGTLYFGRSRKVYRSRLVNGVYGTPEELPMQAFSFAIAPDQSFAVFGVFGPPGTNPMNSDLHISLREGDGWSVPIRFGAPINTPAPDLAGSISPDGSTLYFVSMRRGSPPVWPRPAAVRSIAEIRRELQTVENGLRNIFAVPVAPLLAAARNATP